MAEKTRLAVGLMSGTSADGVSAALVSVGDDSLRVLRHATYPYSLALKRQILNAASSTAPELSRLNFALGAVFAAAARKISRGARAELIGSHGQTVWHGPNEDPPNTLQIGEPAVIAERTGVMVVADFRPRDIAAGGQGAPLVPAFDLFLHRGSPLTAAVNIGGIANVSLVGKGKLYAAFDTGPGNTLMDEAVRRVHRGRKDFDRGGRLASLGRPDERRLKRFLAHPYFLKPPPKSLDRSTFGPPFLDRWYPRLDRRRLPDALATLAELTARALYLGVMEHAPGRPARVVVSGGGAFNRHLMHRLSYLFSPIPVEVSAIPPAAKEAAAFAWLAARTLDGKPGNLTAATGARGLRVLGKMILP